LETGRDWLVASLTGNISQSRGPGKHNLLMAGSSEANAFRKHQYQ
jgi:hypothetical protein